MTATLAIRDRSASLDQLLRQAERHERVLDPAFGPEAERRVAETLELLPGEGAGERTGHHVIRRRGRLRIQRGRDPRAVLAWAIAQRVYSARAAKSWTQEELADRTGIERANIARLERGAHVPSLQTIRRVADALGLRPGELTEVPRGRVADDEDGRLLAERGVAEWGAMLERDE